MMYEYMTSCQHCGARDTAKAKDDDAARKAFYEKGWRDVKGIHMCPNCVRFVNLFDAVEVIE